MIVDPKVEDDFGVLAEATRSALRYSVSFRMDDKDFPPRLELVEECLEPISKQDHILRASAAFREMYSKGKRTKPYVSVESGSGEIGLHQDKRQGRLMKIPARRAIRTAVSGVNTSEYPTVLAAKKEMLSWRTFMLEPSAMRRPSSYRDPESVDDRGSNLASTLGRLQRSEKHRGQVCAELTNHLAELVDDVRAIRVSNDAKSETLTLEAKDSGGVFHPARSLSDGTLRFLALSVLAIDPSAQGMICLEEPENGIHPGRVGAMVKLLYDIAVDPSEPLGEDNPVRQIAINTHSPEVVAACRPDDVIFVDNEDIKRNGARGSVTVTRVRENSWRKPSDQSRQQSLSLGQLDPYLRDADLSSEWRQLQLQLDLAGS